VTIVDLQIQAPDGPAVISQIRRQAPETHRANIYKKLLLESQTDLIALALRRGLLARTI
jgi:hypothetical protein